MTPLQLALYCHFLESKATRSLFAAQKAARVLSAITSLRKLLNHPKLIYDALHRCVCAGVVKVEVGGMCQSRAKFFACGGGWGLPQQHALLLPACVLTPHSLTHPLTHSSMCPARLACPPLSTAATRGP